MSQNIRYRNILMSKDSDPLNKFSGFKFLYKSISAKNSYGDYKEKIYNQKYNYIIKLCELFEQQKWIYGIQNSDIKMISHVIYFEIPDCEQISWHITLKEFSKFPIYKKDWDNKKNSTIKKLEDITIKLLESK